MAANTPSISIGRFILIPKREPCVDAALLWQHLPNLVDTAPQCRGGVGVRIGLVDGAVDVGHPDMAGADIIVRDFVGGTPENRFHATAMALLLVGQGAHRIRGVVPHAQLLAARAISSDDNGDPAVVAAAVDWLADEAADIIALPIGAERDDPAVAEAIATAANRGVQLFAACGSGSSPVLFPARHPLVCAVGPAGDDGQLLECARSDPAIDLLAPGWRITGLADDRADAAFNGSSIACVLAAGAAASRKGVPD